MGKHFYTMEGRNGRSDMRTDKFTQLLERMYETYVRCTKRYGMETMSKKTFMAQMRRMEW